MRLDHLASRIVNANHSVMRTAAVHRVADCMIRRVISQPTEWQRIGNKIDAAPIPEKFSAFLSRVALKEKARASLSSDRPRSFKSVIVVRPPALPLLGSVKES
jgi:hypothetical protein